jgi:hypothetical protein
VFDAIKLSVKFDIAEIRQLAPDWAFARTNSAGRVKVNATGKSAAEGNQELFVFQKVAGDWKIARYCFSAVNPPTLPQQVISIIERVPSPSSEVQSKSCLDITAATTADAPAEAPM